MWDWPHRFVGEGEVPKKKKKPIPPPASWGRDSTSSHCDYRGGREVGAGESCGGGRRASEGEARWALGREQQREVEKEMWGVTDYFVAQDRGDGRRGLPGV